MDSCVTAVTETWLDNNMELTGRSLFRADRTAAVVWRCMCTMLGLQPHTTLAHSAFLIWNIWRGKCRPFKLVRELSSIVIVAVYIPPWANAKLALEKSYCLISGQMNAKPEAAVIVAGDFNHVELKAVFPKFSKYINFPTRDNNTLDQVYSNLPGAYKAAAAPHLGMSDHISVELIPAYKPLACRTKPTIRAVQVWTEEASSALQDCFEHRVERVRGRGRPGGVHVLCTVLHPVLQ